LVEGEVKHPEKQVRRFGPTTGSGDETEERDDHSDEAEKVHVRVNVQTQVG